VFDRQKIGSDGEAHAWTLLKKRGDKLVGRNVKFTSGELDLITWHGKILVFTEVRARSNMQFGSPVETINASKQTKVRRAAEWFIIQHFKNKTPPDCRFDVVWIINRDGAVAESGIIEGAF
jgi:putative endonuclease